MELYVITVFYMSFIAFVILFSTLHRGDHDVYDIRDMIYEWWILWFIYLFLDASWFINNVRVVIAITIVEQECMNEKDMQCEHYNESHEVARPTEIDLDRIAFRLLNYSMTWHGIILILLSCFYLTWLDLTWLDLTRHDWLIRHVFTFTSTSTSWIDHEMKETCNLNTSHILVGGLYYSNDWIEGMHVMCII